jgi:predicted Zn-dependent protease
MKSIKISAILAFVLISNVSFAQNISPDSTRLALKRLTEIKQELRKSNQNSAESIDKMLSLGMWDEAFKAISSYKNPTQAIELLSADYFMLNNDYKSAEQIVNKVLKQDSKNEKAISLKVALKVQAWLLPEAATICEQFLKAKGSEKIELMLGRVKLLQKKYDESLNIAKKVIANNPKNADAYLLEADVHFWDQHPELAEAPLIKSLEINPYNADARFSYGYAIWRRIDATQLNAMAAQWEIALAINPLHFQTHWHWGNGHTNLTYADYAEKNDDEVRKALKSADDLVRANKINEAIAITRTVEKQYPNSVLPLMHRGSIYHIAYSLDQKTRLDSAEHIFRSILARKKHYGPAHNGLAAIIKAKRIPYLAVYDSISNQLNTTKITDPVNFARVFPDVNYYPGNQVKAMIWNQLFTAVVYFPFLSKQNNAFQIPALHNDLAIAMNSPSFRYMTTFDNRQWMDIRGVGSGAAAIEYTEKGAYLERNVVLHEYVHLFHGRVLTDAENRKIRSLYYNAMNEKRTLDYYSQNNESEYFAQTYPAYFEPIKVHPNDFKSMNTTNDLKTKDPEMYSFLDQLVKKERAYLAGNKKVMASNWAQVYLNMSNGLRQRSSNISAKYLDTALNYDQNYLPVYLAYAQLNIESNKIDIAEEWLKKAQAISSKYAPIYVGYANLYAAKFSKNLISQQDAVIAQEKYLKEAKQLEDDYQEGARINSLLRELYRKNGMIAKAIAVAEDYGKNGPSVSTYLRDRKDDAIAYAANLKASLGYNESAVDKLKYLIEQKPQNFEFRNMYADALIENNRFKEAIETMNEAQRILAASGNARLDYTLRIAEANALSGNTANAAALISELIKGSTRLRENDRLRLIRLLLNNNQLVIAKDIFNQIKPLNEPFYMADYSFTNGLLNEKEGNKTQAISLYQAAITTNPYLVKAYNSLINSYIANGQVKEANELKTKITSLKIIP